MKKLEVNAIKLFLKEPVIEFSRPDGGRSIKTISLLDKEEIDLTTDVIITSVLPKLNFEKSKIIRKSLNDEDFATKLNRIISQREYLTNKQIAARASITERYLIKLRNGKSTNPSLKVIHKLAEALECDATELV